MKTGTVIKASRKQIGILVLFDGAEEASAYRHDDVINRAEGLTDLLDGRGVSVGMRVEEVRDPSGRKLRLTGEVVPMEPEPEPRVRSSNQSRRRCSRSAGARQSTSRSGLPGRARRRSTTRTSTRPSMAGSFAELAQRDAAEWASRLDAALDEVGALLAEGQGLAGAIDTKVGVPSPIGLAPGYPGLNGPVIALLRPSDLKAAIARWRSLRTMIRSPAETTCPSTDQPR